MKRFGIKFIHKKFLSLGSLVFKKWYMTERDREAAWKNFQREAGQNDNRLSRIEKVER